MVGDTLQQLRHEAGTVKNLIIEIEKFPRKKKLLRIIREDISFALTYFRNHQDMMDYPSQVQQQLPIGLGVTEAACNTLVKKMFMLFRDALEKTGSTDGADIKSVSTDR